MPKRYTPLEIDQGLTALAIVNGDRRRASRELKAQGIEIPQSTLGAWKDRDHPDRYREIQTQVMPAIKAAMADKTQALADRLAEAVHHTTERYLAAIKSEEISARDLSQAAKNLALSQAIAIDKTLLLRGEATSVVEHRSVEEDISALKRMKVVDAEAVEIPELEPAGLPA